VKFAEVFRIKGKIKGGEVERVLGFGVWGFRF